MEGGWDGWILRARDFGCDVVEYPEKRTKKEWKNQQLSSSIKLTSVEHGGQRRLLGRRHRQLPRRLDLHPAPGVGAVEGRERRLPLVRALVALFLVDVVRDGPQLGRRDVVGELTAFRGSPCRGTGLFYVSTLLGGREREMGGRCTYHPSILQRHHVVNVEVAGGCPDATVEGTGPRPGSGSARRVGLDVGAVALEHEFPGEVSRGLQLLKKTWPEEGGVETYRVLQLPLMVSHVGNRSRS